MVVDVEVDGDGDGRFPPFLPNSSGVPPTLTILANAFRVGGAIARGLKAGEL